MKAKTLFYCTECGNETPKWSGQCPACRAWNTLVERPAEPKKRSAAAASVAGGGLRGTGNRPRPMREVETTHELRFETGMNAVSYTHLDVYKRQQQYRLDFVSHPIDTPS